MNMVGYDAAYNAVTICTVYSIYPEGSRTWRMMLVALKSFLPWFDTSDGPPLTIIHDGEKAASSVISECTSSNVHSFMDEKHMGDNLKSNVARKDRATAKTLYHKALHAFSKQECDDALAEMTLKVPAGAQYLEKYPKAELFKAYSLLKDDRYSSQLAETSFAYVVTITRFVMKALSSCLTDDLIVAPALTRSSDRGTSLRSRGFT